MIERIIGTVPVAGDLWILQVARREEGSALEVKLTFTTPHEAAVLPFTMTPAEARTLAVLLEQAARA